MQNVILHIYFILDVKKAVELLEKLQKSKFMKSNVAIFTVSKGIYFMGGAGTVGQFNTWPIRLHQKPH